VHKEQFYLEGTNESKYGKKYRIKETRDHETKHIRERNKAIVKEQINLNME
jgi:hypothetical protein